jgi:acyl-CoA hydrolase
MVDIARFVAPGTRLWWSQGAAEPVPLVDAFFDQASAIGAVQAFVGLAIRRWPIDDAPEASFLSYGALGELRSVSAASRLDVLPVNFSTLPRLFASGALPTDVALIQVSPPDADGLCSLGVGVDYAADALVHTRVVLAEVNAQLPRTVGGPRLPLDRFAAVVHTDRELLALPERPADEIDTAIAAHVAALIEDRDTLQLGVGSLPAAVLRALGGHQDLGIHSGLISGGVLGLVDKGVITGAYKEVDPGLVVTGSAVGELSTYQRISGLAARFRPVSYTHAPATLAQLGRLVSINSAIEVDLTGQIGAELRGDTYVGGIGGQVDFAHAAAVSGRRSIFTVRSTSRGASAITPLLSGGLVTTGRADVDAVVTEHGVAHLRGATMAQRAVRLIEIAAPEHREALQRARSDGRRIGVTGS